MRSSSDEDEGEGSGCEERNNEKTACIWEASSLGTYQVIVNMRYRNGQQRYLVTVPGRRDHQSADLLGLEPMLSAYEPLNDRDHERERLSRAGHCLVTRERSKREITPSRQWVFDKVNWIVRRTSTTTSLFLMKSGMVLA